AVQGPVPYRQRPPQLDSSPDVLHSTHGRCRLGCRSAPLSRHAESTVRWRSGTNRRIHDSRGQMVGWNAGPSQGQVGAHGKAREWADVFSSVIWVGQQRRFILGIGNHMVIHEKRVVLERAVKTFTRDGT